MYYTPEWVVHRIVDHTLRPRFDEIMRECDWPIRGTPTIESVDAYTALLKEFTVLDPACGSGAFLITALRFLLDEWHQVEAVRRQVLQSPAASDDDAKLIADILKDNLYGVDIIRLRSKSHSSLSGCTQRGGPATVVARRQYPRRKQPRRTRIFQRTIRASL